MSIAAQPEPLQYTPPGRVNFGWITESWQLFMANVGAWIVATLVLFALPVLIGLVFYGVMMASMFSGGFPGTPGYHPPPPGAYPSGYPPGASPFPTTPGAPFPGAPGTNPFLVGGFGRILVGELVAGLVLMVYFAFFYGALFRMAVRQVRGLPIEIKDVFRGGQTFGRLLGASFLLAFGAYGLEFVLALPLLIANHFHPLSPATLLGTGVVLWLILFLLSLVVSGLLLPAYALMADGEGVFTALRRSIRGMKAQWLPAAGFVFVLGLLVYVSEIPCGLGLLATVPMVFLICALAYRDLVGMPNMVPRPLPGAMPGYPPSYPPPAAGSWPPPPGSANYPPQMGPQTGPPPSWSNYPPPPQSPPAPPPPGPTP